VLRRVYLVALAMELSFAFAERGNDARSSKRRARWEFFRAHYCVVRVFLCFALGLSPRFMIPGERAREKEK